MASLAQLLSEQLGRTVLDQTGLKGNYDIRASVDTRSKLGHDAHRAGRRWPRGCRRAPA